MIDNNYLASTTICKVVNINLNVDGSVTPKIFSVSAGPTPIDTLYFNLYMVCASEPDDSMFGDGDALTRGIVFRICDSYHKVLGNCKTNGCLKKFGADVDYTDKGGGGKYTINIKLAFRDMWRIALRMQNTSVIQLIVQDKLDDMLEIYGTLVGHLTVGEV